MRRHLAGVHELRYAYTITIGGLGVAAAQTVIVALLPVLLLPYTNSATVIGLVVGGEGACALIVPAVVGRYSDTLPGGWLHAWPPHSLSRGGRPAQALAAS
jgi:hypothetical protein